MGDTEAQALDDVGNPVRVAVLNTELRSARGSTLVGLFIMSAVLVFVEIAIRPLAGQPWTIHLWVASMATVIAAIAALIITGMVHEPGPGPLEPYARIAGRLQTAMSWLIIVSVWVLLPASGPDLRALMLMMYVWYIGTVIAASNAAVPVPARDIVALTASIVGWVVWDRPPYWGAWAVFLTMAGATMLAFRHLIRRSVVAAIEARVASEAAEAATRAALAAAEAARDAKTRFIASASHDLQQPLQAASLFFEAALAPGDPAAQVRAVSGARLALASTQALIRQMLDHLRLEAGAVTAKPALVALGPLIAAIAAEHAPAARAAGMRLIPVRSRLLVTADRTLLVRAITNLVANAVRHAQGERVLIGTRRRGTMAEIWVIDDGKGIAAADRARLFEDYAQGSDHGTVSRGGFGLGLASVRRALALMGGSAGHVPEWTGGAAFRLVVPLAVADETEERLCEAA